MNKLQNNEEWRQARAGYVTASKFATVLKQPRSKAAKESGELSDSAKSYLYELIGEHLTGEPAPSPRSIATDWGDEHEADAKRAYELTTGYRVTDVGFVKHEFRDFVGGSPDGMIYADVDGNANGLIEAKCPFTTREHVRHMLDGVPPDYYTQIQGLLWITDLSWCDFVSFDPRAKAGKSLHIMRVQRDDEYIAMMSERVLRFRDILVKSIVDILEGKGKL